MTAPAAGRTRIFTIPNFISLGRLALVPVMVVWIFSGRLWAAGVLLAVLGATDWVDGWIARRFDQASDIGKVLDPTADRILLIATAVALLVKGLVPTWFGVLVLAREVVIAIAVLVLAVIGARRIDVQWSGKAGTLALMFAFPAFVFAHETTGAWNISCLVVAWGFAVSGLVLSYWAAAQYVPLARTAVREGRAARAEAVAQEGAGTS
ncbi:MAG: CDP-alcohol phosphatidyltransferase family protein [Acidimicrobiia bacterium]